MGPRQITRVKNEDTTLDAVRTLFDRWASNGRAEGMERGHSPTARQAFERLHVAAGQHYLDIGCGNGYTVRWAADVDPTTRAVGLDLSASMIARAREQTPQPNARFIHAPFPLPLLKARTFHAIFSMEVFYYLPDLSWGVLSAARLLVPGGLFACVVDYYEENVASHGWPADVGVPMTLLSAAEWREKFEEVGLEVIEQTQLTTPATAGEVRDWKHDVGSLLTLARRPIEERG